MLVGQSSDARDVVPSPTTRASPPNSSHPGTTSPFPPFPHIEDPCGACTHACTPAFRRALTADPWLTSEPWWLWLAVRDACPLGREHRYGEDQIVYHYVKDRSLLSLHLRPDLPPSLEWSASILARGLGAWHSPLVPEISRFFGS